MEKCEKIYKFGLRVLVNSTVKNIAKPACTLCKVFTVLNFLGIGF